MPDPITYRLPSWIRWYTTVFAVVWVGITLMLIIVSLGNGTWFMLPVLAPLGTVGPLIARRTWRAGLRLTEQEMVVTPLFGRTVRAPRTDVQSFQQITTAMDRGPWWSLHATITDGRQIDTKVGVWLPTKKGRAQVAAMVATANAWVAG